MAGYLGTKAAFLSTTAASVTGNATIGGDLTVGSNALFVDESAGNVGIGTSSPSGSGLHIKKDTSATTNELLRLSNSAGSTTDGVKLVMEVANTSGNGGEIGTVRDGGSFNPYMYFSTSAGVGSSPVERMRIDSSGRVTMPYQPAFVANTAPATLANNATIVFSSTALNRGSVYNTSNGRFTAPVAGLYQFFASVRIENSSPTAVYHRVSFIVNGSGISWSKSRLSSRTTTGYYTHAASDQLIGCQAGDYVEVQFESSVASFSTSAPTEHVFYGYLIG